MRTFKALIKREFWEHKGGMYWTPLIMAGFFAGLMILSALTGGETIRIEGGGEFNFSAKLSEGVAKFDNMHEDYRDKFIKFGLYGPTLVFGLVSLIISLFYALGSLYDERKDRSILFWKSLPISDTMTVVSKLVAITFAVPLCYFAVLVIFQLFELVYMTVVWWFGGSSGVTLWTSTNLFGVWWNTLVALIVASLWLAPLWGWLMLASAWAKRVAFLWGVLPIIMIAVAEGYFFQTTNFIQTVGERIGKAFSIQNSNLHFNAGGEMFDTEILMTAGDALSSNDFWIGLVLCAVFVAGAIYTRRFRDES